MPQLDLVTFFSQYFWLVFFYLGFYLLLVHHFLPQMARILKVRAAMIQSGATQGETDHSALMGSREASTVSALKGSKNALQASFASLGTWVSTTKNALKDPQATTKYTTLLQENARLQALVQKDVQALLPLSAYATLDVSPVTDTRVHTFHTKTLVAVSKRRKQRK